MSFNAWVLEQELVEFYTEVFDKGTFLNNEPENGRWEPELGRGGGYYVFRYSLPSDPKKNCGGNPCYYVSFNGGSISFAHEETQYQDRWQDNKRTTGGNDDAARNIGLEQINSILYAIGKYVQVEKPRQLSWTPVRKSHGTNNVDARRKVYFMWAAKNLFPDYVPTSETRWQRADEFKRHYGGLEGLPSDEEIKTMGAKKFLGLMQELQQRKAEKEEEDERRREDERRQREQQELEAALTDPTQNPHQIQAGDFVYNKETEEPDQGTTRYYRHGRMYKVMTLSLDRNGDYSRERNTLLAALRPAHGDEAHPDEELPHDPRQADMDEEFYKPARQLYKATPENRALRSPHIRDRADRERESQAEKMRQLQGMLSNPEINPNGVNIGDIVYIKSPGATRNGVKGQIIDIKKDEYGEYTRLSPTTRQYGLYAEVKPVRDEDYDPEYTSPRNYALADLVKATPDNRRVRQYNIMRRDTGVGSQYDAPVQPPADWQPRQPPPVPGTYNASDLPPPPRNYHIVP